MADWKQRLADHFTALYDQIPDVACKGLCHDACGPIDMHPYERARIRQAGVTITPPLQALAQMLAGDYTCPALVDGKCSVYELRPTICFLPDAWIYTEDGPKRIKNVLAGDRVYGKDGRLHRVVATVSRLYEGDIVNVRHTGTHMPCWSTSDHQWLAARQKDKRKTPDPQWRAARELTPKRHQSQGDYLCFPRHFEDRPRMETLDLSAFIKGKEVGDQLEPFTQGGTPVRGIVQSIPRMVQVDEDLLFMLGIYLAEGSASTQAAVFTMHAEEMPILKRISKYLDMLGVTSQRLRVKRNTATLTVSSALFGRLMKALGGVGAAEKRIHPALFRSLSNSQLWSIYEAWHVGDGTTSVRELEMATVTTSEELAVQMGFIALANGLFPRSYAETRSNRNATSWQVVLHESNWRSAKPGHGTKNMYDDSYVYTPAAGAGLAKQYASPEVRGDYSGPVIDIQVAEAESFVTTSGIAHNCRVWGASGAMPCPHGCQPADRLLLTEEETRRLVEESKSPRSAR